MTKIAGVREGFEFGTRIAYEADMAILLYPEAGQEVVDSTPAVKPYACASRDPRALRIIAKSIYREMRAGGLAEEDLMSVASELLSLVAVDMKDRRVASDPASTRTPVTDL